MSFFRRLFGLAPDRSSESRDEVFDRCLNAMSGVEGKARLSKAGRPVCPYCRKEFPASPETMQNLREKNPDGILMFLCPRCHSRIRVY